MAAHTTSRIWTKQEILAKGVRMDGVDACEAALGLRRTKAYSLLAAAAAGDSDALPFPVIPIRGKGGRRTRYVVPTAAVLRLLSLGGDDPAVSA